jgi:cytochrome c biogenesis protein CcmG/thiol:disulfide interchange protein DsbE
MSTRLRVWLRRTVPWLGLAAFAWFNARVPGAAFTVGAHLPAFSTKLADGSSLSIGGTSEQVTVLSFWASYCGPCRAEAPVLSALQAKDVRVVGLSVEDYAPSVVAEQARRIGMQYPVGVAGEALVSRFRVQSVPTTYVLAKNGTIVLSRVGTVGEHELDDAVRAARSTD